jgi:hypothetical protein
MSSRLYIFKPGRLSTGQPAMVDDTCIGASQLRTTPVDGRLRRFGSHTRPETERQNAKWVEALCGYFMDA